MKLKPRGPKQGVAARSASQRTLTDSATQHVTSKSRSSSPHNRTAHDKAAGRVAVVYRPISELRPDLNNPRRHTRNQVRQIARSIESFGFNVPVLVDADRKVLAGHGRLLAAQLLGWSEVPTIQLDHLSETQARAFMIADNRLTEISVWDDRLLAEQLQQLSALDLDFSLEATGFEIGEIDLRIEGLSTEADDGDDPDLAPEIQTSRPVSHEGDSWLLGDNRVHCGSALDSNSYDALMEGKKAAGAFFDPPYNLPIQGFVSGLGAVRHRSFAMASGEMGEAEFTEFLRRAFSLHASHTVDGSLHFVCIDWRHAGELIAAGRSVYSKLENLCVWVKGNGGMGSLYRSRHELIFVYKSGRGPHRNNVRLGVYGRNRTNVWNYPGANSFSRSGREGNLLKLHPTVKPVALVADAILDSTSRRDIVLDGFLGSGTTIIAAERCGRRCYGLEIDPLYVDTIVRRWQAFTKKYAIHEASGRSFNEMEAEVEASENEPRKR